MVGTAILVDRRKILAAFAATAMLAGPVEAKSGLAALVRRGFLFSYPVNVMLQTRAAAISRTGNLNRLNHRRTLSGPADRNVTTPNNDTLYSAAWLDLAHGPLALTMPAAPDRYHSAALLDLFTDNVAILGTRQNGGRGGRFLIAGPGWRGRVPDGHSIVRSPTNDAWMIVRVVVDGAGDLEAARAAQSDFVLEKYGSHIGNVARLDAGSTDNPAMMIDAVNNALARQPTTAAIQRRLRGLAAVGLEPGRVNAWAGLDSATKDEWLRQVPLLLAGLRGGLQSAGAEHEGWSYPRRGIGRFGDDDLSRAHIALGGLGALPMEEAVYLSARTGSDGRPLDGSKVYSLHIPAKVPVSAFWSLSMYEIAPDGRLFFTPNPIDRYAIGDRSTALRREADGSIIMVIANRRPPRGDANWLPAPRGPFALTFRGYLPQRRFMNGEFRLPPIMLDQEFKDA